MEDLAQLKGKVACKRLVSEGVKWAGKISDLEKLILKLESDPNVFSSFIRTGNEIRGSEMK